MRRRGVSRLLAERDGWEDMLEKNCLGEYMGELVEHLCQAGKERDELLLVILYI